MSWTTSTVTAGTPEPPPPERGRGAVRDDQVLAALRRRRTRSRMVVGVLVVVGCAIAVMVGVATASRGVRVLQVVRPVAAGQVLAAADLGVVDLTGAGNLPVVTEAQKSEVVGRTVAVPLPVGVLLSPADVGSAAWPPTGYALVSLAVANCPPQLAAGQRVEVVPGAAPGATGTSSTVASASPVLGVVASVNVQPAAAGQATTLVTLLVNASTAAQVAQIPTPSVLVLSPSGSQAP